MPLIKQENQADSSKKTGLVREDELFIHDAKAALLNSRNHFSMWVLYSILIFILLFFLWSLLFSVEEITVGEGKVIPASKVKIIQSQDGGVVLDILVSEGDIVQKGQVLMRLDDTRYKADYEQKYKAYLALLGMTARLHAEAHQKNTIIFANEVKQQAPEVINTETSLFQTRSDSLKKELAVMEQQMTLTSQIINMYEPLLEKGYASKIEYITAKRQLAQLTMDRMKKEHDFKEQVWKSLNETDSNVLTAIEGLKILRDKMQDTTLVSPVYGVINKLNTNTIGGTISPGMNIMEIFPIKDSLLIEAKINPKDIGFIHLGQKAKVRITAYDYTVYGDLVGTVSYISTDSMDADKPRDQAKGEFYIVYVKTMTNYLGRNKHKLLVMPGMLASVHIITGKKAIIDYLLKPLIKAKEEALRER